MQRIRVPGDDISGEPDALASRLYDQLKGIPASEHPWSVRTLSGRIEGIEGRRISVPGPRNFEHHDVARFLKNLRDASAHGDARNVRPYNDATQLVGFTFACSEGRRAKGKWVVSWTGEITLLEADMRRIAPELARLYCDAITRISSRGDPENFCLDASSICEVSRSTQKAA